MSLYKVFSLKKIFCTCYFNEGNRGNCWYTQPEKQFIMQLFEYRKWNSYLTTASFAIRIPNWFEPTNFLIHFIINFEFLPRTTPFLHISVLSRYGTRGQELIIILPQTQDRTNNSVLIPQTIFNYSKVILKNLSVHFANTTTIVIL